MTVMPLEWVLGRDRVARAIETQALREPSSSRGSSFDDFKKLDCFEEQKTSYAAFMKHGHMIRDCLENKKFIIGKPKEDNKEDKQKPRVQGRMFAMTHQDAQATSNVVIGTIRIYTLLLES
ncbi:hypothetical protein CK203_018363 [Vitis vinifera]|uniref:Uncharacterized protein n=1 Tax=Vitis vinifera TaxID=29760 RepID=A0A438JP90_VITVI|nr:hypothetical protein CK203_018363 [Vitis vinifera]